MNNLDHFDIAFYNQLKLYKITQLIIYLKCVIAEQAILELADEYDLHFITIKSISKFINLYADIY